MQRSASFLLRCLPILAHLLLWTLLVLSPTAALAQLTPFKPIGSISEFHTRVACVALRWIYTLAILVGIIYIILAAFKYITSGGSEERTKEVHRHLIYGFVGIAVAIVAYGTPFIVADFLQGGSTSTTGEVDPCKAQAR